jgi:FKBP-type peptidyl-prolyl cis-trans isomerase 2
MDKPENRGSMLNIGQKVGVHYIGTRADGSEFDNSYARGVPLEFLVGRRQVLVGFDQAVSEMNKIGDCASIDIPAAEAYGIYDESLVEVVPVASIPNGSRLPVGQYIVVSAPTGQMRIKVLKLEDGKVWLDSNHELVGQDLHFEIELVKLPGRSGSLVQDELYQAGSCPCGCDELRTALAPKDDCDCEHDHGHQLCESQ